MAPAAPVRPPVAPGEGPAATQSRLVLRRWAEAAGAVGAQLLVVLMADRVAARRQAQQMARLVHLAELLRKRHKVKAPAMEMLVVQVGDKPQR